MESDKKYTLTVFNTCTREYEEVAVTEEVYRTYYRTGWNIKDNNQRFFDNEIQMSGMIRKPVWLCERWLMPLLWTWWIRD